MIRNVLRLSLIGIVAAAGVATPASAQTLGTYLLTVSHLPIPSNPIVTIEIWASWNDPGGAFVFGGGNYNLTASDGTFISGTNILNGPGTSVGNITGNTITGAVNGQIHLPQLGIHGSPDNPILLASYEWVTTNFTARIITFITSNTSNFIVSDIATGATTQMFPHSFTPGLAMIIPPSPATLSMLALAGLMAARRNR